VKRYYVYIHFLLLLAILLAACSGPTQTPTLPVPSATPLPVTTTPTREVTASPTPISEEPLYVNIIWHQHQPLYYKDENGVYTRPWVRVHGTKDYYDMAATVAKYPKVHVTFNLTPVLLRQLADFVDNGAKDLYWVMSEKPADELSLDDKTFILQRFFDVNWQNIVARFPRYQELLQKRGGDDIDSINSALQTFTEGDYRDLQVWFNLAWFDPDFQEEEPLKSLVDF
jgi:alpha-amylase/alpha-mannosidase (GH57 family)